MIAMIVWNCAISTINGSNPCHSVGQIHFLYTKWNLLPHGSLFHIIHGSMNLLSFNPGRHWGITTPYHSCEDGWRFVVMPWFRQKLPPPPSIAVAMWHLWCLLGQCAGEVFDVNVSGLKKTNISALQKCHGILELVPSTSAWITGYIISHCPIISVSHLWIIIRSLVGVKMPQEAQVLLGFMPESFRDLTVFKWVVPKAVNCVAGAELEVQPEVKWLNRVEPIF